jgi:hypothetical protein
MNALVMNFLVTEGFAAAAEAFAAESGTPGARTPALRVSLRTLRGFALVAPTPTRSRAPARPPSRRGAGLHRGAHGGAR